MSISATEIKRQYDRVKGAGWLPYFQDAGRKAGTSTAHFLAIGSRETNEKNIRGDFRNGKWNGFGVVQVDVGTDPDYAANWSPTNVEPGIVRGAEIYASKVKQITGGEGKHLSERGHSFTGKPCEADDVRRMATAGYNCGLWAYYHFSRGENVDSTTTGHDYSRDVYDRSVEFAKLIDLDGTEPGAHKAEVTAQGKYARPADQNALGIQGNYVPSLPQADAMDDQTALTQADYHQGAPDDTAALAAKIHSDLTPLLQSPSVIPAVPKVDDGTQTSSPASGAVADPQAKTVALSTMSPQSKVISFTFIGSSILGFVKEEWSSSQESVISASQYASHHLPIVLGIIGLGTLGVVIYNASAKRAAARTAQIIAVAADPSKTDVKIV